MKHSLYRIFHENVKLRRVLAFFFHAIGVVVSFWLAFQLRFDFDPPEHNAEAYGRVWLGVVGAFLAGLYICRLYQGLWRFFTLWDAFITVMAVGLGAVICAPVIFLLNDFSFVGFPRSTVVFASLILVAWEVGWRGITRIARENRIRWKNRQGIIDQNVLMIGKPDEADALLRNLETYPGKIGKIIGLVSNSARHSGQKLRRVRIFSLEDDIVHLVGYHRVKTVLFLPPLNTPGFIKEIVQKLVSTGHTCNFRVIPSMDDLASGNLDVSQIRKVSIEDLLYREQNEIDLEPIASEISGKRVLVTGAGGSIGAEISRQILALNPERLVLFDSCEYALFEIERELLDWLANEKEQGEAGGEDREASIIDAVTGDVRRSDQIRKAIRAAGGIDVIYHAAAYKHVDMMERNPVSCFQNNTVGAETLALVAEEEEVGDVVLISTDKAVRPASLMGASKRLAERLMIERPIGKTRFKAVRFGNVLGSSGSVIPIFKEQIARGGPVTVTSKDVTRYFMTIPEAVELVIAAGVFAKDRTISVLEMGDPVNIETLARRMIELSGFVPDIDIPIVFTGLKPGEKEYEELLTDDEGVVKTEHDRIWVLEKSREPDFPPIDIGELIEALDSGDEDEIRSFAHNNIPGSLLL